MALGGYVEFTKEEIERFYPLLEAEYNNGYRPNCPIRAEFKRKYGMDGLGRYREFVQEVFNIVPNIDNALPTLDQLFKELEKLDQASIPKRNRCSIM